LSAAVRLAAAAVSLGGAQPARGADGAALVRSAHAGGDMPRKPAPGAGEADRAETDRAETGSAETAPAETNRVFAKSAKDESSEDDSSLDSASRLLGLCLYELGDMENAAAILAAVPDLADGAREACERERAGLSEAGRLARLGKWRAALAVAEKIPHQSARLLNIRGCILAGAGRYAMALRLFAMAAEKDAGGSAAPKYIAEAAKRKQSIWRMR
jgi:tetratricopeptide (TPR) repeat protein